MDEHQMTKDAALRLALEALNDRASLTKWQKAREAIKQALEETQGVSPEPEPVAWMVTTEMQDGTKNTYPITGRFKDVKDICDFGDPIPLYTHPPKREPLTDEQISAIVREAAKGSAIRRDGSTSHRIARAIEASHGIGEKK